MKRAGAGSLINMGTTPATRVVAGQPGRWEPDGSAPPFNGPEDLAACTPVPATWTYGDYVLAAGPDTPVAGFLFVNGEICAYLPVETAGGPATIFSPPAWVPPDLASLNRMCVVPANVEGLPDEWVAGSYLDCANGERVHWNGRQWVAGVGTRPAPRPDAITHIFAGEPGYWVPPALPAPTAAELVAMVPPDVWMHPPGPWPVSNYITTADATHMAWTGSEWVENPTIENAEAPRSPIKQAFDLFAYLRHRGSR